MTTSQKETFGFKNRKSAPIIDELKTFENRLIDIIKNIEFQTFTNDFQRELKNDLREATNHTDMIVKADKTVNFYRVTPD